MKSAYELAMQRLEKSDPIARLTDSQKELISRAEQRFQAKIAERKLFIHEQIFKARAKANFRDVRELEEELTREITRLNNACEAEKEKIRSQKSEGIDEPPSEKK